MIQSLPSPVLGVKRSLFRLHDPFREEADEGFRKIRGSVLARDKFTCRFCGISTVSSESRPSGYFQVHHLDNDHHNNSIGNLATVCPFCHQVFHAGMAGHGNEPGLLILLPEMGQWDLNRLCHILFVVLVSPPPDETLQKDCLALYRELQDRNENVRKVFGEEAKSLSSLAKAIARLPEDLYERRAKAVGDLRILPIRDAFDTETKYWAENLIKVLPIRSWGGLASRTLAMIDRKKQAEGRK